MLYFEAKRIISAYQNKEGSIESLIANSQFQVSVIIFHYELNVHGQQTKFITLFDFK